MTVNTTLVSQDLYSITINVDSKNISFSSEGFDVWLHSTHPEIFDEYAIGGDNYIGGLSFMAGSLFDLISFNQSKTAKRYYLQYLGSLINKSMDQWDKAK